MRRAHLALLLLVALLIALVLQASRLVPQVPAPLVTTAHPAPAPMVAMWIDYDPAVRPAPEPVHVEHPYACYLEWLGDRRQFTFYERAPRRIRHTTSLQTFLGWLARVPRGATIGRFDTCSVPRIHDMPAPARQALAADMRRRDLTWAPAFDGSPCRTVCTCESRGLRFPEATAPR